MPICERTKLLISIGASMAANCIPCFEHYYAKATAAGIDVEDIVAALETAAGVKQGAHLTFKNRIGDIMKGVTKPQATCGEAGTSSCCS